MMTEFGTSLCCMDGRVQQPIRDWFKRTHGVDFVDTITEAGMDKKFFDKVGDIKQKVAISVDKHKSKTVIISGHHDCAGNPVSKEEHIRQTKEAASVIRSWNLPITVVGAWIDENWQVEVVT